MSVVFGIVLNLIGMIMIKVSSFLVLTTSEITPINRHGEVVIGRFSEITDELCEEFVKIGSYTDTYYNYLTNDTHKSNQLHSAKESFISRIRSEGIDVSENDFIVKLND
jgi:hypothetical protein